MLSVTLKLMACVTAVLAMGYEVTPETTDPEEENKLSESPPVVPLSQTSDTALPNASEERVPNGPEVYSSSILKRARLVSRDLAEDVKRTRFDLSWKTEEELHDRIQYLFEKGLEPRQIKHLYSDCDQESLMNAIKMVRAEYKAKVQKESDGYWREGMHPGEVKERFGKANWSSIKLKIFAAYEHKYHEREDYARSNFAEICEKTPPADVRKKLEAKYPEDKPIMDRFSNEYDKLYNECSGYAEALKWLLKPNERSYDNLVESKRLLEQAKMWWRQGLSPKETFSLFRGSRLTGLERKVRSYYEAVFNARESVVRSKFDEWFLQDTLPAEVRKKLEHEYPGDGKMLDRHCDDYVKFYDVHSSIVEKLKMWQVKGKSFDDVQKELLKLQREKKILSDYMVTELHSLYQKWWDTDWWITMNPDEALAMWKRDRDMTPDDVFALLKFGPLTEAQRKEHKMYPWYKRFVDWYIDERVINGLV